MLRESLYDSNRCVINCKGGLYEGFDITAGIRQGYPLSPLLFAAAVDILLRTLSKRVPGNMVRAFADDTAMVVRAFQSAAEEVMSIFQRFGRVSGLHLNLPKTVVIPLWNEPLERVRLSMAQSLPAWSDVEVSDASRYLGFMTGPGKGTRSWQKAIDKYKQRAALWGALSLGLQWAAKTYNIYAISVLSYLAQLEAPPPEAYRAEVSALRRAAPGPGSWAIPQDLWHLRECYGQHASFRSLETMALSAKVRVATYEPLTLHGASLRQRAANLRFCLANTERFDRLARWSAWYKGSVLLVLVGALDGFRKFGFDGATVQAKLAGKAEKPWTEQVATKVKRGLQRAVALNLLEVNRPNAEMRMWHKLQRWQMAGPEAQVACRVLRLLGDLRVLVAPRVSAALFSALWNRWVTARRFHQRHATQNHCVLGCGGAAGDSIEHYCHCRAVRTCAWKFLRVDISNLGLQEFLMAEPGPVDPDELTCRAVLVYATFRATNYYRAHGTCAGDIAVAALRQHCKNAVEGHEASRRVLDNRWAAGNLAQEQPRAPKRRRTSVPTARAAAPAPVAHASDTARAVIVPVHRLAPTESCCLYQ